MTFIFKEALAWAKSRGVVLPEEFEKLPDELKQSAFTIAEVTSRDQLQMVLDSLIAVLQEGLSYEEWKKRVTSGSLKLELPEWRLNTILQTNMQIHYNRGHWLKQQRTKRLFPYLYFSAVRDNRTRPNHAALHGIIRHIDDPFWETHYPPLGFNCRCMAIAMDERMVEERGGITPEPSDGWPGADEGWSHNYAADPNAAIRESIERPGTSPHLQRALRIKLQS